MQRETPPRLSQMPTQPMEWTPTSTKDDLTEHFSRYRERHSQEATKPMATNVNNPPPTTTTEPLAQYQQAGESQTSHITDAAQLTHPTTRADNVDMTPDPATPRP